MNRFEICDNETGLAYSRNVNSRARKGNQAGFKDAEYYSVKLNYKKVGVHRIVYCIYHNVTLDAIEGMFVDHIDGDKLNNNPDNLRLVTNRQNQCNQKRHRKGALVGIVLRVNGKYQSSAQVTNKLGSKRKVHLGTFDTKEEAHSHYIEFTELLNS